MAWSVLLRMNHGNVLKTIGLFEMLFWAISTVISIVMYFKDYHDKSILNDIKSKSGTSKKSAEAEVEYRKLQKSWGTAIIWLTITSVALFCTQIFLVYGVRNKNRCLVFCYIVFSVIFSIARIIVVSILHVHVHLKYFSILFVVRIFFIYLAARFMLQITNERLTAEEVEPPNYRPQTEDPREFREGLNYPTYPRILEFAPRVAGLNKYEHSHPKRWVPTYDAYDTDGRMVVVVDDPVYEAL